MLRSLIAGMRGLLRPTKRNVQVDRLRLTDPVTDHAKRTR